MVVKRTSEASRQFEPLDAIIRRTFESAQRQLESLVEKQRNQVKAHTSNDVTALVDKIFRDEGYGFLRTLDGQQVYFHKNSCLHGEWERLTPGTGVRYTEQEGEKGLQASSVEIVDKRGPRETHNQLHNLPKLT
jgi:cold shock CspA family protein